MWSISQIHMHAIPSYLYSNSTCRRPFLLEGIFSRTYHYFYRYKWHMDRIQKQFRFLIKKSLTRMEKVLFRTWFIWQWRDESFLSSFKCIGCLCNRYKGVLAWSVIKWVNWNIYNRLSMNIKRKFIRTLLLLCNVRNVSQNKCQVQSSHFWLFLIKSILWDEINKLFYFFVKFQNYHFTNILYFTTSRAQTGFRQREKKRMSFENEKNIPLKL